MPVSAMSWARRQQAGGPAAKLVLLLLAQYADGQYQCAPTADNLARDAELSPVTIRRALRELARRGLVVQLPPDEDGISRQRRRWRLMVDERAGTAK